MDTMATSVAMVCRQGIWGRRRMECLVKHEAQGRQVHPTTSRLPVSDCSGMMFHWTELTQESKAGS